LQPYLSGIDRSRIYSNFGPLATALEARLAAHFGVHPDSVALVANGTLGLALALAAQDARPGSLCVIPAWTFVASVQAAALAGLVPFLVDVDPSTWALEPERMTDILGRAPGEVGAVMPVGPFGQPIDLVAWNRFQVDTRLPVVIDASAGFDSLTPTRAPAVVSLHATKVLGIGEGGMVLSTDPSLIRGVRTRANFGFFGSREALVPALNAKLSEYHAAVGHAVLDEWSTARAEWYTAAARYRERFAGSDLQLQEGFGHSWVSSVCVVRLGGSDAVSVENRLRDAGIETRRWWGGGAHTHGSTSAFPRTAVPVTDHLARSTIGVPMFRDLSPGEIARVTDCVLSGGAVTTPG
jgi:dTDP-4-amino-4,6-dideoxygalactose transaminase